MKPKDDRDIIHGGTYAVRTADGRLTTLWPRDQIDLVPDTVICRRVADYPRQTPPAGAAVTACERCTAPIAFNPRAPHQTVRKFCMQCAAIQPLPITEDR